MGYCATGLLVMLFWLLNVVCKIRDTSELLHWAILGSYWAIGLLGYYWATGLLLGYWAITGLLGYWAITGHRGPEQRDI